MTDCSSSQSLILIYMEYNTLDEITNRIKELKSELSELHNTYQSLSLEGKDLVGKYVHIPNYGYICV